MNDVIQLESPEELVHCDGLECIASQALDGDKEAQVFLTELWEETWVSIKAKLETEGSVWYVWWMDGVHELMKRRSK